MKDENKPEKEKLKEILKNLKTTPIDVDDEEVKAFLRDTKEMKEMDKKIEEAIRISDHLFNQPMTI